ncbi:FliH/SctL family protein [Desulfovibrio psychrotolerans]|nr:FliH/SctL family protein [Desulfovibrio psychrotolerans]
MSSSDSTQTSKWGTIFMGPARTDERQIHQVEGSRSMQWDAETEANYMERVRARAAMRAAEMLEQARVEAENIRREAMEQGYNDGLGQAQQELDEFRRTMSDSVSGVLGAIQGQCSGIFFRWRQDLVTLLRASVRRAVELEIAEDRARILEAVLAKAVETLDSQRKLVIRVNPEDEPAVRDILETSRKHHTGLEAWSVRADAEIGPGGLVVESRDGMVDSTLETRYALVDQILEQLVIPGDGV